MSKPSSDNLFLLIKALSRPEKRYFKVFTSKQGIDNSATQMVFDIVDEQEIFDEQLIIDRMNGAVTLQNLAVTKSRLYDSILRALDAYHSNSSIDAQLKRTLHCAEILYKKSLYSQSQRLLDGAKKLAYKYDKHTSLLEIFMWEKLLIERDNYETVGDAELEAMMIENTRVTKLIEVYNDFWGIKSRLFHILNKKGKVRTEEGLIKMKSIIDSTLLDRNPDYLFYETQYLYNHIYSAYYFGVGDYANSYDYLKANVAHIENNLEKFSEEPNVYFSVLTNIVYIASQLHKYDEVFFFLKKLRELPETMDIRNNEDMEIKLFSSANSIELTIYFLRGEFEKGLELIPRIQSGLILYDKKLNNVRKAFFSFNIAIIYFGAQQFNESLRWTNRLLNDMELSKSLDIYCFGLLLNLLIQIELDSKDLLAYTLRSTQRYLSARKQYFKFEASFMDLIGRLLKTKTNEKAVEHYKVFLKEMNTLKQDPLEKNAFEYFDFISWAESKVSGREFGEVVREKFRLSSARS